MVYPNDFASAATPQRVIKALLHDLTERKNTHHTIIFATAQEHVTATVHRPCTVSTNFAYGLAKAKLEGKDDSVMRVGW